MGTHYGHENRHDKVLRLDFWLTVSRFAGGHPGVKASAGYPNLKRNERAINLKIELPIALFETPSLTASIVVEHPDQAVSIDTSAIAEAVYQAIGMDVEIAVVQPGDGE